MSQIFCCARKKTLNFSWTQEISFDFTGWRIYISQIVEDNYELLAQVTYDGVVKEIYTTTIILDEIPINIPVMYYFVITSYDINGNESAYSEVKNVLIFISNTN